MESRAKIFGHALHQMLVVFPLGLLVMALIFDGIALATRNGDWHQAAFWMIGAGLISGLLAAVPGIIDWIAIPMGTRAKSIGLFHGLGNIGLIVLFTVAWLLRKGQLSPREPGAMALAIEIVAVGLGIVTAWLGGELVNRLGVGVDRGANLNAPNSLSGTPAMESTEPVPAAPSSPVHNR
jgi:uncharacterized membrane protein